MPPKETPGNLPQQSNQPDQTPQQANPPAPQPPVAAAPTPASSNPGTDESGVTPPPDPTLNTPATGVPTTPPSGSGRGPFGKYKKLLVIAATAAIVLVIAALFLPFSPLAIVKAIPKGPKMMVGDKNRFVYACSVFDADTVGKKLSLDLDKSKQNVEEALSFDPSNTKDKTIDLLKQTGESSVSSNCKLKFDRAISTGADGKQTTSFINVSIFIQQFPGEKEASDKFKESKDAVGDNAKTLASYGDSSYYVTPVKPKSGPTYVQPVVKYKNMVIYFTAPLKADDQQAEKMVGQLDKVTKDVLARIDKKQGDQPKNFSGVAKIGKNKFVDACQSVNYQKLAQVLGGEIQYEPASFTASQNYAPNDGGGKSPKHLISICGFDFRTKADADAAASQRPELPTDMSNLEENAYKSHYPHFAYVQILTAEKKEDAQKILTDLKKSGEGQPNAPKVEDVKIGDMAIKVDSPHDETNPYDNKLYYIAKGAHTYLFSISYKRQSQPFKTTDQSFTDDQAKKVLDVLDGASTYAQKK